MNKRPGHVVVTTEVGFCSFCGRPRNLRREAHQLGALVRTIVTCETCHRTLSSSIGVTAAEPEPAALEPEPAPTPEPAAVAPAAAAKPAAKAAAGPAPKAAAKPAPKRSASAAKTTPSKKSPPAKKRS